MTTSQNYCNSGRLCLPSFRIMKGVFYMVHHRKQYVWLISNGCVLGYNLDHLNDKIDQFNASKFLREKCDFWEWLSWEEGEEVYGYSPFWNDGNPAMSRVHKIGGKHHV